MCFLKLLIFLLHVQAYCKINAGTLAFFISMILLIVTVLCSVSWTLLYIMKSKVQVSDEESVIPAELPQETQKADIKVSASERPSAVNVTYVEEKKKRYLRAKLERINHLHLIEIEWSRLKHDKYIYYDDYTIKNTWTINRDVTFNVTSKLRDKRSASKKTKYFKVRMNHSSLESPIERTILREEGVYYLITEGDKTPLPQVAEDHGIASGGKLVPNLRFRY